MNDKTQYATRYVQKYSKQILDRFFKPGTSIFERSDHRHPVTYHEARS